MSFHWEAQPQQQTGQQQAGRQDEAHHRLSRVPGARHRPGAGGCDDLPVPPWRLQFMMRR